MLFRSPFTPAGYAGWACVSSTFIQNLLCIVGTTVIQFAIYTNSINNLTLSTSRMMNKKNGVHLSHFDVRKGMLSTSLIRADSLKLR